MQLIPGKRGRVYVDYAHTPDALGSVLSLLQQLAKGRVIVIFGCGGDRDRLKRPLMVEAAAAHADEMMFTLDNPRSEDPEQIFADMRKGLPSGRTANVEHDRSAAIRTAVHGLQKGDVLLIAGKGHESIQEIGSVQIPYDDREVAARWIAERDNASAEGMPLA
jgi:UDP-N-acetylmuramoyl-L-alanyl-D-glutamate--2,6-diaminopimelate ligase